MAGAPRPQGRVRGDATEKVYKTESSQWVKIRSLSTERSTEGGDAIVSSFV